MLNIPRLQFGLVVAVLAGGFAVACGGGDGGDGGSATTTGGAATGGRSNGGEDTGGSTTGGRTGGTGTGGADNGGSDTGGAATGGDAGAATTGGTTTGGTTTGGGGTTTGGTTTGGGGTTTGGTGGTTGGTSTGGSSTGGTTGANVDDLISAICAYEFGCCEAGERTYRLGPSSTSVEDCISDFTYQYHESNTTNNPYPAGTASGLLGTLGYVVNPARVTENAAGIQECIDAWTALDCPTNAAVAGYCAATYIPGEGPCSLVNLFDPALAVDAQCTAALAEGDGNDVECPAGSTCLPASDPDNENTFPACVTRGTEGNPCTEDVDCDWDFYCNAAGDCTAKGDIGDPCTFDVPADPMPNQEDEACRAGLKCNPVSLTCVANCDEEYPCSANIECPNGLVCAPTTVGEDATSWHTCQPVGADASARCDDSDDCIATRRCAGGVCQADLNIADPCTSDAECEAGSFCDLAIIDAQVNPRAAPGLCTQYFNAGDPCFLLGNTFDYNSGCNPNTAPTCAYNGDNAQWECTTSKRPAGALCYPYEAIGYPTEPSDCAAGLHCERVLQSDPQWTCTPGADLGDPCDTNIDDWTEVNCGVGLWCDPDAGVAGAECVAQLEPGADCDNPAIAGAAAESNLCRNGACVTNWDTSSTAPDFICTDAAVPVLNEGDGLICNGN